MTWLIEPSGDAVGVRHCVTSARHALVEAVRTPEGRVRARALSNRRWHAGAMRRGLLCAASLLANGCEYATDAVVLTRLQPTGVAPDAASNDAYLQRDSGESVARDVNAPAWDAGVDQESSVAPSGLSSDRLRLLTRSIEVQDWNRSMFSAADLQTLRSSGFRSLRVAFPLPALFDDSAPATLKPAGIAAYDEILNQVLGAGLAVVIHPAAQLTSRPWRDATYLAKMGAFWRSFAAHLVASRRDPARVFLKIEFDPGDDAADAWYAAQTALVQAVRAVDPDRTLLLTPNALTRSGDRNTVAAVTELPVGLTNAVFDFGFFLPAEFTHQGANWRPEPWMETLHDLPYPSSPAACAPILPTIMAGAPRIEAQKYCDAQYQRQSIAGLLEPAISWAKNKNVQLINGAFGVYKRSAPTSGRLEWLTDVRSVFEANGIPWTYYDDSPNFTMLTGPLGRRTVEPGVLSALGMTGQP